MNSKYTRGRQIYIFVFYIKAEKYIFLKKMCFIFLTNQLQVQIAPPSLMMYYLLKSHRQL